MAAATRLREGSALLLRHADRDLSALWREVSNAAQARIALMDILPSLIETYGAAAATLASDWYDEARDKAGIAGAFSAIPVESSDRGAQALVGWATSTATDITTLQTLLVGGIQRRIADHMRLTVAGSSVADPGARGWRRVGDGNTCNFCSMLLGRGAVYTEATADFQSHDHCGCQAEPAWR